MDSITQDVSWNRKVQLIYEGNLSSRLWSDGGFVAFRGLFFGNCSRMLWIELAVCHVRVTTVCITTDRQSTSIIRMSAKIDYQLLQVCLSVFLFVWKNWGTAGRKFREM